MKRAGTAGIFGTSTLLFKRPTPQNGSLVISTECESSCRSSVHISSSRCSFSFAAQFKREFHNPTYVIRRRGEADRKSKQQFGSPGKPPNVSRSRGNLSLIAAAPTVAGYGKLTNSSAMSGTHGETRIIENLMPGSLCRRNSIASSVPPGRTGLVA